MSHRLLLSALCAGTILSLPAAASAQPGKAAAVSSVPAMKFTERKLANGLRVIAMRDTSICGLGQAAPNCVTLTMKHFPADVGIVK